MLALQGTLTVTSFHPIFSSMDEHALDSGYISPSGSMGRRARAPTPPQHRLSTQPQQQLPPQWTSLGDTRLPGERSPSNTSIRVHLYFYYRAFSDQG